MQPEQNSQIKANAISAYLFVFISWTFLLNKQNPLLNNSFVKSHTLTASFIHICFFITAIIFLFFGTGISFSILNYSIDQIIAITLFIALFGTMLFGIYKANKGETFNLIKTIKLDREKLIKLDSKQTNIDEKSKLTIILSRIPFLGFLISPRYKSNEIIKQTTKLNVGVSFLIIFLYIFGNSNLATLFLLAYIVLVVFMSINLAVNNRIININLSKTPSLSDLRIHIISSLKYLKNYFRAKDFRGYEEIFNTTKLTQEETLRKQKEILSKKPEFKLPSLIIYIPILNLASLFNINSKLQKHIINGIIITILLLLSWGIWGFHNNYQLLLLFPIFFGFGNLKVDLSYEIPFVYDIFLLAQKLYNKIGNIFSFLKKKHKQEKKLDLKV